MPLLSRSHTVLLPAPAFTAIAAIAALVAAPRAYAQANLTFTGGSGSPFSLTLAAPVTYIITTSSGSAQTVTNINSLNNFNINEITPDDLYTFG